MSPIASPEEDQHTEAGTTAGIDQAEAYANDPANHDQAESTGNSAETSKAGSSPTGAISSSGQGSSAAGAVRFLAGHKKGLLIGGGALAGILVPIVILFALLSLFKLTDIEKLYFDYQFTKVHGVIRQRAKALAKEAKGVAKGNASTVVDPEAPLETEITDLNASELNNISDDPSELEAATDSIENVVVSDVGIGAETDAEFGVSRDIEPMEQEKGESDADFDKKVLESDNAEVQAGETVDTSGPVGQDAENIENDVKSGLSPEQAIANAAKGSQIFGLAAKLGLVNTVTTLWCIGKDIYDQADTKFEQIRAQNLVRAASRDDTAADAQREGVLTASQVQAYNQQFDNGTESYTQSASYDQATGQPVTGDPINPASLPFPQANSGVGGLIGHITAATAFLAHIPGEAGFCTVFLNPGFQIGAGVGELVLTAIAGIVTGGQDITFEAVLQESINQAVDSIFSKEALKTVGQIGAAQGAKYLAASIAASKANANVTGTEGPIQKGNVDMAGHDVLQSETLRLMGGRALTGAESLALTNAGLKDQQDADYSLLARVFDPEDPQSPTSKLLAKVPQSPSLAFASLFHEAGIFFSPTQLIHSFNGLVSSLIPSANADSSGCDLSSTDGSCDPYNVPQYGFTDAELNEYQPISNANYVEAHPEIAQDYAQCFIASSTNTLVAPATAADGSSCSDPNNTDLTRYRVYLLDKQVVWSLAVLYNKVPANATAPVPVP